MHSKKLVTLTRRHDAVGKLRLLCRFIKWFVILKIATRWESWPSCAVNSSKLKWTEVNSVFHTSGNSHGGDIKLPTYATLSCHYMVLYCAGNVFKFHIIRFMKQWHTWSKRQCRLADCRHYTRGHWKLNVCLSLFKMASCNESSLYVRPTLVTRVLLHCHRHSCHSLWPFGPSALHTLYWLPSDDFWAASPRLARLIHLAVWVCVFVCCSYHTKDMRYPPHSCSALSGALQERTEF